MKCSRVFLIVMCILAARMAYSQSTDSLSGRKALTFSFNGFNLGGGIDGKYWISSSTALRLILSGSYHDAKLTAFDIDQSESISITVTPAIGIEKHYYLVEDLNTYWGGGFSYSFHSNQTKYYSIDDYSKSVTDTYSGTVFVGVEYRLTRSISVAGEQQISLSYNVLTNTSAGETKTFDFGNSTSALQLLVYF